MWGAGRGGGEGSLYRVVGLALLHLGLEGVHLELGLLQLADALAGRALILVQLALLLLHQTLQHPQTGEG